MSDELKQFYREMWDWIQDGFPEHKVFHTQRALCTTLSLWGEMNVSHSFGLYSEQCRIFTSLGGVVDYPFNLGFYDWVKEREQGGFYHNQKRLSFIEEHAK